MRLITILALAASLQAFSQTSAVDKAKALYEAKKYEEAIKVLMPVDEDHTNYGAAQYYLGRIAFDQKRYDDAEEFFDEAIEADDKVADYHYWMGSTLGTIARDANVLKQGMIAPRIKDEFEATVKLDPSNMDAHWGLISFYTEAPGFMGGSYDKALAEAASIAKMNAADGHRAYGQVYNSQQKFVEAEKEYLAAYKANPSYTGPIVGFYLGRKEYNRAFPLLEEALKKDPTNMLLVYSVGRTSAIAGQQLDRGEECLKKYLTYTPKPNEPSHAGAQMRLGQITEKRGNKAEAKKLYEAALKQDATLREAKEGLERVSK